MKIEPIPEQMVAISEGQDALSESAGGENAAASAPETHESRIVRFMAEERGKGEDLYWCQDRKRVFIRQVCDDDHVRWLTASKWQGGYEADCHLREGLTLRAVAPDGRTLFEEKIVEIEGYSGTVAAKKGPFSWEATRALAREQEKSYGLRSHDEWKEWLLASKPAENKDYWDNWVYWLVDRGPLKKLACLDYLGKTVYATVQEAKHKVCGKSWLSYEIRDAKLEVCLAICGYKFEEDER